MNLNGLSNCIAITPAACEAVAPIVRRGLEQARRDGYAVPAELLALADELEMAAAASRERRGVVAGVVTVANPGLSSGTLNGMTTETTRETSVTAAAQLLGISRQAVDRRCRRGTLPCRTDERGRRWIPLASLDPTERNLNV